MSRPAAIDKRPGGILMCWETEKLWDFIKSFKSLKWMYQNRGYVFLHFCDMIFHLPKKKAVSLTKYSFNFRGIFCWADLTCRVYSWVKKSNINATDPPSTTNSKFFGGDFSPYFNKKDQLELTKRFRYLVHRWKITNHPTDFAVTAESWIGPCLGWHFWTFYQVICCRWLFQRMCLFCTIFFTPKITSIFQKVL